MSDLPPRLDRERKTVQAMVSMRCRSHEHGTGTGLCTECRELADYAAVRLERCPFGSGKPTCTTCEIHCYRPPFRERMREVMRESGSRMLWRHPILAILHLIDSRRAPPDRSRPAAGRLPTR